MNPGLHASIWLTGSKSEMKVFLRIFLLCGISSISSSSIRASRLALSCTSSVSAAASNLCFSASCIRITVSPASRSRTSDKIFSMAFMISAWLLDGIMSFRFQMVPGGKMHVRTKDLPVKAFIKYSFHKLAILRSGVIKKKKTTTQILCLCSVFIKCQKKKKKSFAKRQLPFLQSCTIIPLLGTQWLSQTHRTARRRERWSSFSWNNKTKLPHSLSS